MTSPAKAPLYSPQLLALATELANFPFDPAASCIGEAHARSCGSSLVLSCDPQVQSLGMRVTACAVGQAAAAIFARHAGDRSLAEISDALAEIEQWLGGGVDLPGWPDLALLAAARDYPGRHGALVLPWRAAIDALSKNGGGR